MRGSKFFKTVIEKIYELYKKIFTSKYKKVKKTYYYPLQPTFQMTIQIICKIRLTR